MIEEIIATTARDMLNIAQIALTGYGALVGAYFIIQQTQAYLRTSDVQAKTGRPSNGRR